MQVTIKFAKTEVESLIVKAATDAIKLGEGFDVEARYDSLYGTATVTWTEKRPETDND